MNILVVDIGGNNVKVLASGVPERRKIPTPGGMTPARLVEDVLDATADWDYEAVSIGYPGAIEDGHIIRDPKNLGEGWVGFDFTAAFGRPTRVINDAAMQALGSYHGEEMLFLGLGTGLGAALILGGRLQPLEIAHLPYRKGRSYEHYLGKRGLERLGRKKWERRVHDVVERFHRAFLVDYVVLGGGNARLLEKLPEHARRGSNDLAFEGGFRMWSEESLPRPK